MIFCRNGHKRSSPEIISKSRRYDGKTEEYGARQNLIKDETFNGPLPLLLQRLRDFMRAQLREYSYLGPEATFVNEPEYSPPGQPAVKVILRNDIDRRRKRQ